MIPIPGVPNPSGNIAQRKFSGFRFRIGLKMPSAI